MSNASQIDSPCVNVCAVDGRSGLCRGCGRTLKEIAGWSTYDTETRQAILRDLPKRNFLK